MIPVIAIEAGSREDGSDFAAELVSELAERGVAAGIIKYSERGASAEIEGGAAQFASAGAAEVCFASAGGTTVFRRAGEKMTAEELAGWYFAESEVAFSIGGDDAGLPKILLLSGKDTAAKTEKDENVIAIVTNNEVKSDIPIFSRSEIGKLTDLIIEKFPAPRLKNEVRLRVNGKTVQIKPFVQAFIANTVKGMVVSLRGGKKPDRVDIRIGK